jgi:hypothetical protein
LLTAQVRAEDEFQEIHSYYKTLAIADFFADIVTEGEEIILAANKKWRRAIYLFLYRGFVININAG